MKIDPDEWLIMTLKMFLIIFSAIISYEAGLSEKRDPNDKTSRIINVIKHAGISVLTVLAFFVLIGVYNDDVTIFVVLFPLFIFTYMRGEYMSQKPSKTNNK